MYSGKSVAPSGLLSDSSVLRRLRGAVPSFIEVGQQFYGLVLQNLVGSSVALCLHDDDVIQLRTPRSCAAPHYFTHSALRMVPFRFASQRLGGGDSDSSVPGAGQQAEALRRGDDAVLVQELETRLARSGRYQGLRRNPLSALYAPTLQHVLPVGRSHSDAKPVGFAPLSIVRLKSAFHLRSRSARLPNS